MQRPWVEAAQSAAVGAVVIPVVFLLDDSAGIDWTSYGVGVLAMGVGGFVGAWIRRRRATRRPDG
jgi:hypothetical protein